MQTLRLDRYISAAEAAKKLNLKYHTFLYRVRVGKIKGVRRVGKTLLIPRKAV